MKDNSVRVHKNPIPSAPVPQVQINTDFTRRIAALPKSQLECLAKFLEDQAREVHRVLWQREQQQHQGN